MSRLLRTILVFLCVLPLALREGAFAQNANDFMRMFGGFIQQGMVQAAQSEWRRLPPNELSCLDQGLRQQGASIDALVNHGVMPSDPRLSQLRSNCRVQIGQQSAPPVGAQPSPYVVDGLALYGHVRPESQAYQQYQCSPSEKFPGFTGVTKRRRKGPIAGKSFHRIQFCTTRMAKRSMSIAISNPHFSVRMTSEQK